MPERLVRSLEPRLAAGRLADVTLASAFYTDMRLDPDQGISQSKKADLTQRFYRCLMSLTPHTDTRDAVLPFRPLFFCAAGFASLGMLAWAAFLHLGWLPASSLPPVLWHSHEMLFGFGGALVGGFLLTASANWTGQPTTNRLSLAVLVGLWLAARLATLSPQVPLGLTSALDVGYFLALAAMLARVIVRVNNRRNFFVIGIALLFAVLDIVFYVGTAQHSSLATLSLLGCVDLLTALMVIMGGRVIPFFTRRRIADAQPTDHSALKLATNLGVFAAMALDFGGLTPALRGGVWLSLGVLVLFRLTGWNSLKCRAEPMLWVLHLGYLWLAVGMAVRGFALLGVMPISDVDALHALTVGALGTLGLGMMTRVAQGHSGCQIRAGWFLALAFALPSVAAVLRLAGGAGLWPAAGTVWTIAFTIYLGVIGPLLWHGRAWTFRGYARQT